MSRSTRGQVEAALSNAIIQFEKEHLGRGPAEARAFIIEDMIIIRLRGVLTPAETTLAKTIDGHRLIKRVRQELLEGSRPLLEAIVQEETGIQLVSLHTDVSTKTGERIIVFTLAENLAARLDRVG